MTLDVQNLSFSYDDKTVLDNVTLKATNGEIIAFLGPNGVGKTTLFRCLLGFLEPSAGTVLIDNKAINTYDRKSLAKKIAYIPQNFAPSFNHTVLDTVIMGTVSSLGFFEKPGKKETNKAHEMLNKLGIEHLSNRGSFNISGGERQLMVLCRALIQGAPILIMDEPTSNLDYGNSFRVMEQIEDLKNQGYTILFSTHSPDQALRYATRIVAMKNGTIIADEEPQYLSNKVLEDIYGINVELSSVKAGNNEYRVCTPFRN
ncbi:MAG: ABC transporter ATP-binding protein [Sphaerochaetaceae bacterium]|nr:ABC transporter ATP-binding protein [Sphaerochaetaceae bacterium]